MTLLATCNDRSSIVLIIDQNLSRQMVTIICCIRVESLMLKKYGVSQSLNVNP